MLISDIADVAAGIHISPAEANAEGYQPLDQPLNYFQLSNITDDGLRASDHPPTCLTTAPPAAQRRLLKAGDVLLPAKGARLMAAAVAESWLPAVAASSFYVITLRDHTHCLPEFLALVLNLPATREELRRRVSSAITAPSLNRGALAQPALNRRDLLSLPLLTDGSAAPLHWPSLQMQRQAVTLLSLWHQEKTLVARYLQTREQVVHNAIKQTINH
ncbi:MAG: hypothetical protein M3Y54_21585 [Bacteroidota bacterium]|nr:hypothetical protein [Bacteroidota bacterium]